MAEFVLENWDTVKRFDSTETDVCKFVFTNTDSVVETVLYRYPDYLTRTVICCSTMSGRAAKIKGQCRQTTQDRVP